MRNKLSLRQLNQQELADYLGQARIDAAEAVDSCRVYRCQDEQEETLVIALPGGNGLLVSSSPAQTVDRRRRAG